MASPLLPNQQGRKLLTAASTTGSLIVELLNDHLAKPRTPRLSSFLHQLARILIEQLQVAGLSIVAWESEDETKTREQNDVIEPLAIGACSRFSSAPDHESYLSLLQGICSAGESAGLTTPSAFRADDCEYKIMAFPLRHQNVAAGALAVWYSPNDEPLFRPQIDGLLKIGPLLTASIQAAIRAESWTRLRQMNALTQELFERSDPERNRWDLQWLAGQLSQIYEAEGVTIFIEENEELLLSASTDQGFEIRSPMASYKRGQGLTGYVYEQCRSLRIRDDKETIRKKLGIKRDAPSHVEYDGQGKIVGQFLGAPLRFGREVVGVVRLSRRSDLEPFTQADESSLQFLGDLLGSALGNWRRLHLADAILESINEGMAVSLRPPGARGPNYDQIVFVNPGIAAILDRSSEEVETLDVRQIYAPGEYEKLLPGLRLAKKAAQETGRGEYSPDRSALRRKDGSSVPVKISFRIQRNQLVRPPAYYTIAMARDLSEVEQLAGKHKRLDAFLDALDVAYFRADMQGRTLETTDADRRITGYSRDDWQRLSRAVLYEHEGDWRKLVDLLRQRNDGKLTRHLLELRRKGGERFWAEVDLRLIRDKNGDEIDMEGFYRDVTAQMKLQRFLNQREDILLPPDELFARLKETTELQIDYTSSIGHQIQTPLGSLLGTIESVRHGILKEEEFQDELRRIIGQLRVCSRLVRNLSYMDMVLRREPIRVQQVALRRMLREVNQDFSTALDAKNLTLDVDIDSIRRHLDVIYGHPELLRQVFANLIDNAIKYSRPYSIIHIRAYRPPVGPTLDVMNRGIPIHPSDRERIFERGVRSPHAKALVPHGTGLGLWLVREILTLHRATINYTEVPEGPRSFNCFRIVFPHNPPMRSPLGD